MMGISAFYNGMIYNEAFAIPIDLYGSCYSKHYVSSTDGKI